MKRHFLCSMFAALGILMLGLATPPVSQAVTYNVIDLGALGGTPSEAHAVNNSGEVVGWSTPVGGGGERAFLYSGGTISNLGTLLGGTSVAWGVNDFGQVVGYSTLSGVQRAFLYSDGTMTDLGGGVARGINDSGQVAGYSGGRAFLYSDGIMTDLGDGIASAINGPGEVVGWSGNHAFLYSGGTMTDLGTLGGGYSQAFGINDSGQVVGLSDGQAFLYSGGTMTGLGGFAAYSINNSGQVVGTLGVSGHAFLYSGGTMTDLNDLLMPGHGWDYLSDPWGINDVGQIVGRGYINGQFHAYLATPTPIPGALWLLGSGLIGLVGLRKKAPMLKKLLAGICLCIGLLALAAPGQASLVAYYSFDGNANDAGGNGYNGEVHGATLVEDGYLGQAYSFDGNDYISSALNINPSAMPQITMGAWVKADDGSPIRQVISHDNGGYDRSLGIDWRGGGTGWSAFSGSGGVLGYQPVSLDTWTFIAVAYDQTTSSAMLYVDGVTFTQTGFLGSGWDTIRIGSNPSYGEYFIGVIDEVFFFDEALSKEYLDGLRLNGVGLPPVPIPGAVWLLGSGLIGLVGLRRKFSR